MKKTKYKILSQDCLHEYDVVVKEEDGSIKYSLSLSDGDQWSEHSKGKHQLSMVNDGNGVIFDKELKTLKYDELTSLRILINLDQALNTNSLNREKYKVLKTIAKI